MRIAFGVDEPNQVSAHLQAHISARGHEITSCREDEPWPDVGRFVGDEVASGRADLGVVCCWTGTGVSIAANKVPGVRAALCTDAETARGARRWNDANVLAVGLRLASPAIVEEMFDAFITAGPDADELPTIARVEG